jgi:hypothetical protein
MKDARILIIASGKIYGPFLTQEVAGTWAASNTVVLKGGHEFYAFWPVEDATEDKAHECGTLLPSVEEATQTSSRTRRGSGAAMLLSVALVGAFGMVSAARASCCIPPQHPIVVTSCGKVAAVYVTTKTGFAKYDGPIAVRYAQYVPLNQRIDSGCKR